MPKLPTWTGNQWQSMHKNTNKYSRKNGTSTKDDRDHNHHIVNKTYGAITAIVVPMASSVSFVVFSILRGPLLWLPPPAPLLLRLTRPLLALLFWASFTSWDEPPLRYNYASDYGWRFVRLRIRCSFSRAHWYFWRCSGCCCYSRWRRERRIQCRWHLCCFFCFSPIMSVNWDLQRTSHRQKTVRKRQQAEATVKAVIRYGLSYGTRYGSPLVARRQRHGSVTSNTQTKEKARTRIREGGWSTNKFKRIWARKTRAV